MRLYDSPLPHQIKSAELTGQGVILKSRSVHFEDTATSSWAVLDVHGDTTFLNNCLLLVLTAPNDVEI